eukprot:scaffold13.g167.t1
MPGLGAHKGAATAPAAAWLTPGRLLVLFCCMCIFVYLDRGMIASNGVNGAPAAAGNSTAPGGGGAPRGASAAGGSGIQGDFGLSLFQDGLLPAAFMVGLLASSPIFAEASKHHNALRLIGAGLAAWTAATAGCGLAPGFGVLLVCRMAVGVGEASFVALASPFIDDNAPPEQKTLWLGIFYMCIPSGYALGYIYGGLVGSAWGWRAAFLLESAAMVPFVAFCLLAPPIDIRGTHDPCAGSATPDSADEEEEEGEEGRGGPAGLPGAPARGHGGGRLAHWHARRSGGLRAWAAAMTADLLQLWRHSIYVWAVAGMTGYTAVLGAFAFYGPKAAREVFAIQPETADITFGAITVATGEARCACIVGTLAGGALLDRLGSSLYNALVLCAAGMAAGAALVLLAFARAGSFALFSALFAAGQLAMFTSQAPSNAVCMWGVPPGLRPFAMSMSVVAIHVCGDVPSPPALGALQGALRNWRASMSLLTLVLLLGAAAYAWGARAALTARDYRDLGLTPVPSSADGGLAGRGGDECGGGGGRAASGEAPSWGGAAVADGGPSQQQQLLPHGAPNSSEQLLHLSSVEP